jgi:hypothetical protein
MHADVPATAVLDHPADAPRPHDAQSGQFLAHGSAVAGPAGRLQRRIGHVGDAGEPAFLGVRDAGVFEGAGWATGNQRVNYLTARAVAGLAPAEEHALATYPAARRLDTLSVTLVHGYDIGIASHWNTKTFDGPPGAWRH